jgi:tricorn protease-like protein
MPHKSKAPKKHASSPKSSSGAKKFKFKRKEGDGIMFVSKGKVFVRNNRQKSRRQIPGVKIPVHAGHYYYIKRVGPDAYEARRNHALERRAKR